MSYAVGAAGACFIWGLALWPSPYERLHGVSRLLPLSLFSLSALLLIGAACT